MTKKIEQRVGGAGQKRVTKAGAVELEESNLDQIAGGVTRQEKIDTHIKYGR